MTKLHSLNSSRGKLLSASSIATLALVSAFAQPAMAQEVPTDYLDEVIVTATVGNRSQIESSISVTKVDGQLLEDFNPSSEAELFRLLPGIQTAGTAGPGGNANIAVRGLPVATGGSPFVQIQEDGLPTVLFGDIQFGNNDYWTKFDATTAAVEAVRGGTATTMASQAPGAVINYISHTGEQQGGFVKLSTGLGFDEQRVDFRYGAPVNDTLRYHVGGFFKTGEGPLDGGYNLSESVQIKANATQEFDDGNGFFRLMLKYADTQEPNYAGAPLLASVGGGTVGDFEPFPGFDGRDQANQSALTQDALFVTRDGSLTRLPLDGITTKQKSIGGHFSYDVSDVVTVENKMRWSDVSGAFAAHFLGVSPTAGTIGSTLTAGGAPVAEVRYANGPNAGNVYTDTYLDNNALFRTDVNDLGSFVNDLTVTGNFDVESGTITARAGYFLMSQDIAMDWKVNKNTRELAGDNAALLDLFDANGNQLTQQGISGYNNNWGDCCARDYDLNYTNKAPYVSLGYDTDRFTIDGSLRFDSVKATGSTFGSDGTEYLTSSNGVDIATFLPTDLKESLDYSVDYTSWTAGALYKVNSDLSVFARGSKGNRFNADRQTYSGKINGDGSLTQAGEIAAVDTVNQYELGVKGRGDIGSGAYTAELTLLKGDFTQSSFEINQLNCESAGFAAGTTTCILDADFRSKGAEFYGTYRVGDFSLIGNATWTDSERKAASDADFSAAPNQPDLSYSLSGNYDFNDLITAGLSVTGQSGFEGGGNKYPSAATFNGLLKFRPFDRFEVGIEGYNLFNTYAIRTEAGIADGSRSPAVLTGPAVLGRTLRASVKYDF